MGATLTKLSKSLSDTHSDRYQGDSLEPCEITKAVQSHWHELNEKEPPWIEVTSMLTVRKA